MITLPKYPPNYKEIEKAFPSIKGQKGVVFTFGGIIFNPSDSYIDEPLALHESMHSLQQDAMGKGATGPKRWWKKYINDPEFRLNQELQAYRVQYKRFCELQKDRNRRAWLLNRIATDLSSEQYGSVISKDEAIRLIREQPEPIE